MKRSNISIAVTGMNASDNPGPGVPVIRAIRHSEEFCGSIIGLTYDPLDPGVYMDNICDHVYLLPYPSEGAYVLKNRILEIHKRTPIDVIVPTLDSELALFILIQDELKSEGIHTFLPTKESLDLRSKSQLSELDRKLGISVPKGKAVTSPTALQAVQEELGYPIVIKGQFYEAYIAWSPAEADFYFKQVSAKWGMPVVVQEYITGQEYDVVALGDGLGGLTGAVSMKKIQLTSNGKAWGGITINDPGMNAFVEEVIEKIKWRGPCELEIMKSSKDDKYYLLEINPRFPAWSYLAPGAGQNLQWATVKLALGEAVPPFESYTIGTMFLRNSVDQIYSLSDYQEMTTVGELHRA